MNGEVTCFVIGREQVVPGVIDRDVAGIGLETDGTG
jgi:hypothetical protein